MCILHFVVENVEINFWPVFVYVVPFINLDLQTTDL